MWCDRCFEVSKAEKYRIIKSQDEEGFDLSSEEDKSRYLIARNGDYLIIIFQCELYHFKNWKGVDSRRGSEHTLFLKTIRRVKIDALWSRDPETVDAT